MSLSVNKSYVFSSNLDRNKFKERFYSNIDFANFIGSERFKVIAMVDHDVTKVQRISDGKYYPPHGNVGNVISEYESQYFSEFVKVGPPSWEVGVTYRLHDAQTLLKNSVINRRFLQEVGFNPFTVKTVLGAEEDIGGAKTSTIGYLNSDGAYKVIGFTLTSTEFELFRKYDGEITNGYCSGKGLVDGLIDGSITNLYSECSVGTISLAVSKAFFQVTGSVNIDIKNETERLKAIEYLNSIKIVGK